MKNLIFIVAITSILASCSKEALSQGCGATDQNGVFHRDSDCNGVTDDGYQYQNNGGGNTTSGTTVLFIDQVAARNIGTTARLAGDLVPVYSSPRLEYTGYYLITFLDGRGGQVPVAVHANWLDNLRSQQQWQVRRGTTTYCDASGRNCTNLVLGY